MPKTSAVERFFKWALSFVEFSILAPMVPWNFRSLFEKKVQFISISKDLKSLKHNQQNDDITIKFHTFIF